MKAFQLSHDESEPFFTAQKGNSYTCCVLAGPSSKSMTNYLEEKRDKECTFEGLQGSLLLLKMITFNHYQQIFIQWTWTSTVSAEKKEDSID